MLNKLILIVVFNVIVSLTFVTTSLGVYSWLNNDWDLTRNNWTPFEILTVRYAPTIDNQLNGTKGSLFFPGPNYPFMLFWVSTLGNMAFIVWILLSTRKIKPTT